MQLTLAAMLEVGTGQAGLTHYPALPDLMEQQQQMELLKALVLQQLTLVAMLVAGTGQAGLTHFSAIPDLMAQQQLMALLIFVSVQIKEWLDFSVSEH